MSTQYVVVAVICLFVLGNISLEAKLIYEGRVGQVLELLC